MATFEKSLQSGYALAHLARALGGGKERIFVVRLLRLKLVSEEELTRCVAGEGREGRSSVRLCPDRQHCQISHFCPERRTVGCASPLPALYRKTQQLMTREQTFIFETNDLYQAKNIPKVIYCIHALSHLLERSGTVGGIQALSGRIEFTGQPPLPD